MSGDLFEPMVSWDNLWEAARRARRGKSRRPDVEEFHARQEELLPALRQALLAGEWRPGGVREYWIRSPKRRKISCAGYPDRLLHHALVASPVKVRQLRRIRALRRSAAAGKADVATVRASLAGMNGHLGQANAFHLRRTMAAASVFRFG